ncbi:MAG TPA: glycosyltransferase family 39 protein [Burkholderiaceae bacterium]|nr:glycosyltransferase family 39 protein [Burkholderiaceae bacterium]
MTDDSRQPDAICATAAMPPAASAAWRERLALLAVLALALTLRLWAVEQGGWGAEYYSAAVRSMALNWHNFVFAAFDPAGFISVDKPPVALWLQVASVKLLGYRPFALMLPQVLMGVACVWVLHRMVRRTADARAALAAALLLALTPVLVAVNRTNNMDSALVLAVLLSAWALLAAAQTGRRALLLLSMAALGVAFNVKMLAAFIVLPALVLTYAVCAPLPLRRRIGDLLLAAPVLVVCSLSWALLCESTAPDKRPFVGSSQTNSVLELMVGHNGLGRFVALLKPAAQYAAPARQARPATERAAGSSDATAAGAPSGPRSAVSRLFVRAPAGPLRLFDGQLAAQAGWWLPVTLTGLLMGAWPILRRRGPPRSSSAGLVLWGAWLATAWVLFSSTGGIMHFYYLATLAPPMAALAGLGVAALWRGLRTAMPSGAAAVVAVTAAWQLHIHATALDGSLFAPQGWIGGWAGWLVVALLGASSAAAIGLLAARFSSLRSSPNAARLPERSSGAAPSPLETGAGLLGAAGLLILPVAWALSSVLLPGSGLLPAADLQRLITGFERATPARYGQLPDTTRLVTYLQDHWDGERYLLATSSTHLAAPMIIAFGEPVMARGGFHGVDPAMPLERFVALVEQRKLRFAMVGDLSFVSRRMARNVAGNPVTDWIRANGRAIDPALWRGARLPSGSELYDLRPAGE